MKPARVSIIKNNINVGDKVPMSDNDCDVGMWIDQTLLDKGHKIDRNGIVDLPEYQIDNKCREQYSKAHYTQGSMTMSAIKNTPNWYDTSFHKKTLNQNQITWNSDFQEVVDVRILDMNLPEIQEPLRIAYENLREKMLGNDVRIKNITSDCGWAVFDGYNHEGSYRFRITNTAMKKIKNLSKSRDTRQKLFEEV